MGSKNRGTPSMALCFLFIIAAAFQVCFSATIQPHSGMNVQTKPPNTRFGSSLVFPLQGNVYPNGFYYTSMYIGNPPNLYFLDVDTGSNLTWVQCAAAENAKLLKAPHPPYIPKNNVVFCTDPLCAFVQQTNQYQCKSPKDQCDYEVEYADSGSSLGVLIRDSFSLKFTNGSVKSPTLAFGCGYDQQISASFPPPFLDGVLGLGKGKSSILSQLRSLNLTRNVIGHCFSGLGGGILFLGEDLVPSGVTWTPMLPNSMNYYVSGPVDILVGGKTPIAKGLNMVFDSGSTYSYLNSQAYSALLSQVNAVLKGKPLTVVKDGNLPVCWKGTKPFHTIADVRNYFSPIVLSFTKSKNVLFGLPPDAYLIVTSHGNVCLGILNSVGSQLGNLNVIGDISMQNKLIIYDNERQMIGWTSSTCSRTLKP